MKKLSEVVAEAKRIAKGNRRNYPYAARVALSALGFPSNTHKTQIIRKTYIVNDGNVDGNLSLWKAVLAVLGREGGDQAAMNREARRQTVMSAYSTQSSHKGSTSVSSLFLFAICIYVW